MSYTRHNTGHFGNVHDSHELLVATDRNNDRSIEYGGARCR